MTAIAQPKPSMTVEEFFAWDGGGHVGKLELVNGIVRAQTYVSEGHGTIHGNVTTLITNHLRTTRPECRVVIEGGVIPVFDPKRNVRKPDLTITCSPHVRGARAIKSPLLIVELLSPSNAPETWESIQACATVATVVEILVLDSERMEAQVFVKDQKGAWSDPGQTIHAGGVIRLASIDMEMAIEDAYRGADVERSVGQARDAPC
jgi:Uma2 family endonuclease